MKKIGITISNLNKIQELLYTNGINQNIIFLYNYFKKLDSVQVYFISDSTNPNFNSILDNDLDNIKNFDYIIIVGLIISQEVINLCKENNTKIIFWRLGNDFTYDTTHMLFNCYESKITLSNLNCDEIWISPHFQYSIDYYKYIHKNENVIVAPYFWKPDYISKEINNTFEEINIGVFESNQNFSKSCFIPVIICDKALEYINKAYILGSKHLYDKSQIFRDFASKSELFSKGRLTFEDRHQFEYVIKNYCNIVVSFVENCDLNYLFFECFYLGIPLIHNSKMLKDYGYYYEGCNVSQAAEHIKNIKLNGFNKEEYIARHKEVLYKYSLENPKSKYFLKKKLELS